MGCTRRAYFFGLTIALCVWSPGPGVRAEDAAKDSALTECDGSVRAQGGFRLAVSHTPNPAGDQAVKIGRRVEPQVDALRTCYREAVLRNPRLEGDVIVRLTNVAPGGEKVHLERDQTGDVGFHQCLSRSLARVKLRGLPLDAAALVEVRVTPPGASIKSEMNRRARNAQRVQLKRNAPGQLQSEGQTQGGEVQFALEASDSERDTLVAMHREVSERLAGLLDCRRRSTRRGETPRGQMVFDVHTHSQGIGHVRTVDNPTRDPRASQCVEAWLKRGEARPLPSGQVRLTLRYGP